MEVERKKFVFNYSDEEFIDSDNGIFIKRFSKHEDVAFEDLVASMLEKYDYEGVCYIGKQRGEILFEHIDQDVWEQCVEYRSKYVIYFVSGDDMKFSDKEVTKEILKYYKNKNVNKVDAKFVINCNNYPFGTREDKLVLDTLIKKALSA